jgi:hypothetical protein
MASSQQRVGIWLCCQCSEFGMTIKIDGCGNCGHRRCLLCEVSYHKVQDTPALRPALAFPLAGSLGDTHTRPSSPNTHRGGVPDSTVPFELASMPLQGPPSGFEEPRMLAGEPTDIQGDGVVGNTRTENDSL